MTKKKPKTYETNYRKFLLQHTEENIEDMFRTGVYEIVNKVNGKRYIGSAAQYEDEFKAKLGFYVRWYLHVAHLQGEGSNHHCQHFQRAWNKYGHENFEFRILEFCEPDDCIEREQYYLDLNWDSGTLYNICPIAGSNKDVERTQEWRDAIGEGHAQDWEFISPEGELVYIHNLAKFCRDNNLQQSLMGHVYANKRGHHKGWSAVGSGYVHYKYEFVSPDGVTYKFVDLKAFCEENGLCQPAMSAVHLNKGKKTGLKQYKGWHLLGEAPEVKVYYLLSPEGEVVSTTNLSSLCEKYGLNSGSLSQMLLGNLNHHHGWSTPERPYNPEVKQILSPDGILFEFTNTKKFCDERGLCHKSMSAVLTGSRNHYKKWSRPDNPYKEKEVVDYYLISPDGLLHTTNDLKTFGEDHELDHKKLSRVLRGLMGHHRGWTKADDQE
jgi:group I intron endonuclease